MSDKPIMPTVEMRDDMQMITTWGVFRNMREEIERLRAALEKMQRGRDRYREALEAEKARAALKETGDE